MSGVVPPELIGDQTALPPLTPAEIQAKLAVVKQMRGWGASDDDVRAYLNGEVPGSAPNLPAPRTPSPNPTLTGLASSAMTGAGLGYGSQIAGAISALGDVLRGSPGTAPATYLQTRDAIQRNTAATDPGWRGTAEGLGGILAALATGGLGEAAEAAGLPAALSGPIAQGMAMGAVGGSSDTGASNLDRLKGGAFGAAVGGAIPLMLGGLGALGSKGLDVTGTRPITSTSTVSSVPAPEAPSSGLLGKFLNQLGVQSAQDQGDLSLLDALKQGGTSLDETTAAAANAPPGKPITAMDVAPELLNTARGAQAQSPAVARPQLANLATSRDAAIPARVSDDLVTANGAGMVPDAPAVRAQLVDQLGTDATTNYNAAYAYGAVDNPAINKILQRPAFASAWGQAQRDAANAGRELPTKTILQVAPSAKTLLAQAQPGDMDQLIQRLIAAGAVKEVEQTIPDVQALDYVKKVINGEIPADYPAARPAQGAQGHTLSGALSNPEGTGFLDYLDDEVPAYAHARNQYAETAGHIDALDAGQAALGKDPRVVAQELQALPNPRAQELYRFGLLDQMHDAMNSTEGGRSALDQLYGTPNKNALLNLLTADPANAATLAKNMATEGTMATTDHTLLGGTQNAPVGPANPLQGVSSYAMARAAGGNPLLLGGGLLNKFLGAGSKRTAAEVGNAIAQRLTAGGTGDRAELLNALQEIGNTPQRTAVAQYLRNRAATALTVPFTQPPSP